MPHTYICHLWQVRIFARNNGIDSIYVSEYYEYQYLWKNAHKIPADPRRVKSSEPSCKFVLNEFKLSIKPNFIISIIFYSK